MRKGKALSYKGGEKIAISMITFGVFWIFIILVQLFKLFKKNN